MADQEAKTRQAELEDLKNTDLSGLMADIENFNRANSLGVRVGNKIRADLGNPQEPAISFGEVNEKNQAIMEKVGLSLEPVKQPAYIYSNEGELPRPEEIRFNLAEGPAFLNYLDSLNKETISASQGEILKNIIKSLEQQLVYEYDLEGPGDERLLELFGSLEKIIKKYVSLDNGQNGLAESSQELEKLLKISREGYLREYLKARYVEYDLMAEAGGQNFGPSKWHTDITPVNYSNYWHRTILLLEEIRQNPAAGPFYRELVNNLSQSLDYAIDDLAKNSARYTDYQTLSQIAVNFREKLKDF